MDQVREIAVAVKAKGMAETRRIGLEFAARRSAAPELALAPAAACVPHRLSCLDGPLSHLLSARNEAELELARARLNVERFLAACEVIMLEARGEFVSHDELPVEVKDWVRIIRQRATAKATVHQVQRAD